MMDDLPILKIVSIEDVKGMRFDPVDAIARVQAQEILNTVKQDGMEGLLDVAVRLGDIESKETKIFYDKESLKSAFDSLDEKSKVDLNSICD